MIDMSVKWPHGARVAVTLTFDFDAETLWLARDPENAKRPGTLSQGTYGAKVGVPMILQTLREADLKGTFFIPGWTVENHSQRAEMILREGHEIGHHSYSHRWADPAFPDLETEEMEKGLEALKRVLGVVPRGYRSPAGETNGRRPTQAAEGWNCTEGQKGFVLRIINESKLDKQEVEALAQQLFGAGVKELDKLQTSQLIEELLEKTGRKTNGRRSPWQGRQPARS